MLKTSVETLRAALLKVLPVCERRTTIPILNTVRLSTGAGTFKVSASNPDMQVDVDGLGETTGAELALNPRQILSLVRFLPKTESVELTYEGKENRAFLTWKGGKGEGSSLSESVAGEHLILMPLRTDEAKASFVAPFREAA